MVQASLPPVTLRKPKKKARCSTPVNIDMTESSTDSKFQETLLDEGCGTQVDIPPHPYIFPVYSPGHRYNPHTSCKHVGPSRFMIFPLLSLPFPSPQVCYRDELRCITSYFISLMDRSSPLFPAPHCLCLVCIEQRLVAYCPDWWTFPLWAAFRGWYKATDPVREQQFADRCAVGIAREYMYNTFVKASPAYLKLGNRRE
jgi:hypothetical protein